MNKTAFYGLVAAFVQGCAGGQGGTLALSDAAGDARRCMPKDAATVCASADYCGPWEDGCHGKVDCGSCTYGNCTHDNTSAGLFCSCWRDAPLDSTDCSTSSGRPPRSFLCDRGQVLPSSCVLAGQFVGAQDRWCCP
jgi:hypothetical protein